jgi:predicted phage terminase large subunit-like protein
MIPDEIEAERLRLELRLTQLETQDRSRKNFLDFVRYVWPEAILGEHHKRMAAAFDRIANGSLKRLIVNMPPRHAIVTSMKIPTVHGFKTMAELQPGDHVFGPDGLPVAVLGKSGVFRGREIYRVWTDDGAYLDVDGEHLWSVRLDRKRPKLQDYTTEQLWRRQNGESLRTTRDGRAVFIEGHRVDPVSVRAPRLPDTAPVQYPNAQLPVDPYVLGLWLGDGTACQAIITADDADMAVVRPEVELRGFRTTDQATRMTFGVLGLKVKLRELGVLGNKHIPALYMTASEQQRRALLKGLMDSDGNVAKHGQCIFAQSNRALCEQVQQLVRSLGIKASLLESRAILNGKDYGPTWKVSFYASDVFCLPRKEVRTLKNERTFGRYIRIEKLGTTADTQCIKVDREDGLFLAGEGYICTHNTKSEFASYLLPAFLLGRDPRIQVIESTHTAELAVKFGRKVRDLVDDERYRELFPDVALKADSKAAGRWDTNKGGTYFAVGVGGAMTGRGADILIVDDPHTEGDAASELALDNAWDWYQGGPRTRLQPGGAIVVVMTRWGTKDLTARLLKAQKSHRADKWEVIEFPAILPSGRPLWPEYWKLEELLAVKASLSVQKWNALYQQQPTNDEGAILKREWWRVWPHEEPPVVNYIIQSMDTAYSKKETADFSVITTWGVFWPDEDSGANIILLDVKKGRWDFPELKRVAKEQYEYWKPDNVLIEAKATGVTLQQELRRMSIPVTMYSPGGRKAGTDKISRANSVAPMFEAGMVWAPDTDWAEGLVEECAAFPNGDNDDQVDSTVQAMMRFRQGNFVALKTDDVEESGQRELVPEYY